MGKKVLFCASTFSHLRQFHEPYLRRFAREGWEVWAAAGQNGDLQEVSHQVVLPFQKHFFSLENGKAFLQLRRLMKQEQFDLVSVHTALAGAVLRAAAWTLRRRPKICYICHGYLFGERDGLRKWIYLLPESLCARVTDLLLVMNDEDEQIARRRRLGKKILRIPGMGFSQDRFHPMEPEDRKMLREQQGFSPDQVVYLYAAEFSKRKNQQLLVKAAALTKQKQIQLVLAGQGQLWEGCRELANTLGVSDRILFPGQIDPAKWFPLCDGVLSSSYSEGLPFHLMEGMSCGLAAIVTDIKGHRDLVQPEKTGLLCPMRTEAFAQAMDRLAADGLLRRKMGLEARQAVKKFSLKVVEEQVWACYQQLL